MKPLFAGVAWEDRQHGLTADRLLLERVNQVIRAVQLDLCGGIGKPVPPKHVLALPISAYRSDHDAGGPACPRPRSPAGVRQPCVPQPPSCGPRNFSPRMPAAISPMQATRASVAGSLNSTMPSTAAPMAPMPVHTA